MVNIYTIIVNNKSGQSQDYALLNAAPEITTNQPPKVIFSNVFASALTPADGQAKFTTSNHYYAITGSSDGAPGGQVTVNVSQTREITLGQKLQDNTLIHGTTLNLEIIHLNNKKTPSFAKAKVEDASHEHAFEIVTPAFERRDALQGNWLIGVGGADQSGSGLKAPLATFIPEPLVTYEIYPNIKYKLVPAQYEEGAIIDVTKVGAGVDIDFKDFEIGVVKIVHSSDGKLTIQK